MTTSSKLTSMVTEDVIALHDKVRFPGGLNPFTAREATVEEEIVFLATMAELERRARMAGMPGTSDDDQDNEEALTYLVDEYGWANDDQPACPTK